MPNPLIGVVYHWLGGLASASFYDVQMRNEQQRLFRRVGCAKPHYQIALVRPSLGNQQLRIRGRKTCGDKASAHRLCRLRRAAGRVRCIDLNQLPEDVAGGDGVGAIEFEPQVGHAGADRKAGERVGQGDGAVAREVPAGGSAAARDASGALNVKRQAC